MALKTGGEDPRPLRRHEALEKTRGSREDPRPSRRPEALEKT
jgi:hypothetical protein